MEQFALIATKCAIGQDFLIKFIQLLHLHLSTSLPTNYQLSQEFFQLFCRLLNNASLTKCSLPNAKELLKYEIDLLRNVRVSECYCNFDIYSSDALIFGFHYRKRL